MDLVERMSLAIQRVSLNPPLLLHELGGSMHQLGRLCPTHRKECANGIERRHAVCSGAISLLASLVLLFPPSWAWLELLALVRPFEQALR